MPRNKDRLYLALYNRPASAKPVMPGKEDKYHWAFLIGPKHETTSSQGTKCHAKDNAIIEEIKGKIHIRTEYQFEERKVWLTAVDMIVVRILLGKVHDKEKLLDVLRGTRVKKHGDAGGWNDVSWTKDVLDRLANEDDVLGASVTDWETVRHSALWYIEEKRAQHRFDGKAIGTFDKTKVPTWNLVHDIELEP
ncbi:hypothetical protein CERZMDRAFT_112626 [Cercospora zeae-maydis SCOH1-5]|uniref:Uncharacterized protein n=1 Tax=Cercospora zeae-maydis SCOH1-5 TaxID=717836 RepID=A0A6A6FDN0_9PEZI|nr:hypothetical protein CERZMDRAFT_112626 [Cercospora zeae-maydis SCOH1-5]